MCSLSSYSLLILQFIYSSNKNLFYVLDLIPGEEETDKDLACLVEYLRESKNTSTGQKDIKSGTQKTKKGQEEIQGIR